MSEDFRICKYRRATRNNECRLDDVIFTCFVLRIFAWNNNYANICELLYKISIYNIERKCSRHLINNMQNKMQNKITNGLLASYICERISLLLHKLLC